MLNTRGLPTLYLLLVASFFVPNIQGEEARHGQLTRPGNDDFASRLRLVGGNARDRFQNAFATAEQNEPGPIGVNPEHTVWWTWKARHDGAVFLRIEPELEYAHQIGVYIGETFEEFQTIGGGFDGLFFNTRKATNYQIVIDDLFSSNGTNTFRLHLRFVKSPRNDDITDAVVLRGKNVRTIGSVAGASIQTNEPFAYPRAGHSVWWKWTAPEDGRYTFRVTSESMNPLLSLYLGEPSEGTHLDEPNRGNRYTQINYPLLAGDKITIRVDGERKTSKEKFTLNVKRTPPPPNDLFANRISLSDAVSVVSNEGAETELDEPLGDFCCFGGDDYRAGTLWWQLTPQTSGWYTIRAHLAITSAVPVETIFRPPYVYAGDTLKNLQELPLGNAIYTDLNAAPLFLLSAGTNYSIQVSDLDNQFGEITLSNSFVPPPSNDHFTNATWLPSVEDLTIYGITQGATPEPGELGITVKFRSSVWWRWLAPADGVFTFTGREGYGISPEVFVGDTLAELVSVPWVLEDDGTKYSFEASQGEIYYIRILSVPWYPFATEMRLSRDVLP